MEVLLLAVMTASNIICFWIGAKVGQKVTKGEPIEVPAVNPLEAIQRKEAQKEAERVKDKVETIMWNIDHYDGTGQGQKDVPR